MAPGSKGLVKVHGHHVREHRGGRQAGRHGAATVVESLHLNPQAGGRDS